MATETMATQAPERHMPSAERTRAERCYRPNCDIHELPEEILVVAEVPGAKADSVDVRFEDGMLTIHARVAPREEGRRFLMREYGVGDFHRSFEVSEAIDATKISAEMHDGVLTLHLPKAEAMRPRKIAVKAS